MRARPDTSIVVRLAIAVVVLAASLFAGALPATAQVKLTFDKHPAIDFGDAFTASVRVKSQNDWRDFPSEPGSDQKNLFDPYRERRVAIEARAPGGDGDLLTSVDVTDVRQAVRDHGTRTHRRIGQHVETKSSVALDPLRVQQWSCGDSQRRAQGVTEQVCAGSLGESPHAWQRRSVGIIPRVRPIRTIAVRDGLTTPFAVSCWPANKRQYITHLRIVPETWSDL